MLADDATGLRSFLFSSCTPTLVNDRPSSQRHPASGKGIVAMTAFEQVCVVAVTTGLIVLVVAGVTLFVF